MEGIGLRVGFQIRIIPNIWDWLTHRFVLPSFIMLALAYYTDLLYIVYGDNKGCIIKTNLTQI
jgi:hypothetical protein